LVIAFVHLGEGAQVNECKLTINVAAKQVRGVPSLSVH
jgi:hypothetical protein